MTGPFEGIRVIDFTHVLAGPACSFYLGILGAEVIKVESPGRGDGMRYRGGTDKDAAARGMSTAYLTQGAGKSSVEIDLESQKGARQMRGLLAEADVFVENHLPATTLRLGLDWESTQAINPRLIHCSMTGYGRGGPMENTPAYDVNIQAASGLMTLTGSAETGPLRTGAPIVDYGVALAAGFAISAALFQRQSTSQGSFIDVSMLETAHCMMSSTITDFLSTGNAPKPRGNAANSRSPGAGNFECKDGLLSLGVNEESQFVRLAKAMGRSDWLSDPRFQDSKARAIHASAFEAELTEELKKHTAPEWEHILQAACVPVARVRTLPESLRERHAIGRGFIADAGDARVPTLPFKINNNRPSSLSPAPRLGADTNFILSTAKTESF